MDFPALVRVLEAKIARIRNNDTVEARAPRVDGSPRQLSLGFVNRQLLELGRERAILQDALAHVVREEHQARHLKACLLNTLVPINKLPEEVLSEIFSYSLSHCEGPWACPAFAVCQRWRNCAIRTPALWSMVKVRHHCTFEQIHTILERSRAIPLHVELTFPSRDPGELDTVSNIHQFLGENYSRCSSLKITLPLSYMRELFPLKFNFASLRELYVNCVGNLDTIPHPVELFSSDSNVIPPSLQSLTLYSERERWLSRLFNIESLDVSLLTRLRIGTAVAPDAVWSILEDCFSLTLLEWTHNGRFIPPRTHSQYSLPNLTSLTLRFPSESPMVFFGLVKVPHLRHLDVQLPMVEQHIARMLDVGLFPGLRFLKLAFMPEGEAEHEHFGNSALRALFAELTHVEELWLDGLNDANLEVLRGLTLPPRPSPSPSPSSSPHSPPEPWCPALRCLFITGINDGIAQGRVTLKGIGTELVNVRIGRKAITKTPLRNHLDIPRLRKDSNLELGPSSDVLFLREWYPADFTNRAMAAIGL